MSNYNSLKTTIDANIKQNGNQEITGQILNSVLNQMVTTLGAGYQFAGVATIDTNPGTPDAKVFYIANGKGTYEKFGGINVTEDDVVVLYWDTAWHKVSTGIASQAKLSELESKVNTKVFTNNFNANKVIRKLFIDTSEYTGTHSLDGLKIDIIAKNVDGLYGIKITNSNNELLSATWETEANNIQSLRTSEGIYVYVEYNWDNMSDGSLSGGPFELTNEVFNSINDPRRSVTTEKIANEAITTEKIANEAITTEKIANEAITTEKIANEAITTDKLSGELDFYKMKLTPDLLNFNASNVFNILDYEGLKANPEVWPTSNGSGIVPIISIEEQNNPLGLKYSRCFTISDLLYNNKYYASPYFVLQQPALKGVKTKSFCFYINIKYLYGQTRSIYYGFNSDETTIIIPIRWGTDTHKEASKSLLGTTSYLSIDIRYFEFKGVEWAFVKGKFWVEDVSVIQNDIPYFLMQFVGGQEHVGEKTITCGWTFVAGDYDLLPFQYYPYNKNFFELFTEQNVPDGSITTEKIKDNAITQQKIDNSVNLSVTTLTNGLYGQVGDSISEGAGLQTLLDAEDIYNPISGTRKATYGYYIAKLNRMRWANYANGGSTLGFVVFNGVDRDGFSKENGRYTQMDDNLTHISIFFGWNDAYYGPMMKKEEWLINTYNTKIYYPSSKDLIGTIADDGTPYATQEQYNALNGVTGNVGGIEYNTSAKYFEALYIGTENDSTNKTFWGAWNIVLPYLINKYPLAKILLIVPFGSSPLLRKCVRDAAKKYGLATYDFSDINNQLFFQWDDNPADGIVNGKSISQFRIDNLTYDGLHPNENGYKYMYPSINAKLMSL